MRGMDGYLGKPFRAEDLYATLRNFLSCGHSHWKCDFTRTMKNTVFLA